MNVNILLGARELSISSEDNTNKLDGNASIPLANSTTGLKAGFNSDNSIKINYSNEDNLAKARSNAIQTCVDIYNNYKYSQTVKK